MNKKQLLLSLLLIGLATAANDVQESNPLLMSQDRFEKDVLKGMRIQDFQKQGKNFTESGVLWLIYFYAPWSESSERLEPVWQQVATRLLGEDKYLAHKLNVRVAQVDCQQSKKLCEFLDIQALPSLRVLEGSKAYEYISGEASPQSIISFLQNQAYRASSSAYDFVKGKIQDAKEQTSQFVEDKEDLAWTLWGRLRNFIFKFLSLGHEGYLAYFSEKLFRMLGFGALNMAMKMVGFFMIVVVPLVIVVYMLLIPEGGKQLGGHVLLQQPAQSSAQAEESGASFQGSQDIKEKKES